MTWRRKDESEPLNGDASEPTPVLAENVIDDFVNSIGELPAEPSQAELTKAVKLLEALRARLPEICFAVEAGLRFGQEPEYAKHIRAYRESAAPELAHVTRLCAEGVTKLIALHPRMGCDELLPLARELIAERAEVTHSGAAIVEIAAPGVTKAHALARYCAARGIARDAVVAFGDMPNDVPMLEWAGHAVAVANAHPDVLAIATEVTSSNDQDGVAIVLEQLQARLAAEHGAG